MVGEGETGAAIRIVPLPSSVTARILKKQPRQSDHLVILPHTADWAIHSLPLKTSHADLGANGPIPPNLSGGILSATPLARLSAVRERHARGPPGQDLIFHVLGC